MKLAIDLKHIELYDEELGAFYSVRDLDSIAESDWAILDVLYAAINSLSLQQRKVLHYYAYRGYSLDETARILEVKKSTVRNHFLRARKKIRDRCKAAGVWHENPV